MIALVVAAEVAFWLILVFGLTARYLLARPRLGMALLVATPVVDLALLAATTIDLRQGGGAGLPHALAAVYIGVSIAWGQRIIRWADAHFSHRFAGGPVPEQPPRLGRPHAAHQRREWLRHLVAWATGTAILGIGVLVVGDLDRTWALLNVAAFWTLILVIDFGVSFSYTLWPRRPARHERSPRPSPANHADGSDRPLRARHARSPRGGDLTPRRGDSPDRLGAGRGPGQPDRCGQRRRATSCPRPGLTTMTASPGQGPTAIATARSEFTGRAESCRSRPEGAPPGRTSFSQVVKRGCAVMPTRS